MAKKNIESDELKSNDKVKIETQSDVKKDSLDLTDPTIDEIKNKTDLSDTAVNIEEVKDKVKLEETKEVKKKPTEVKPTEVKPKKIKSKKVKLKEIKPKEIKPTEVKPKAQFDIDDDFFTNERKRKINEKEYHQTYTIDQFILG